jgi:hypothetical protein
MERLFICARETLVMRGEKNITQKIFDNVLFLAEVFGDQADQTSLDFPSWKWRSASSWTRRREAPA